MIRWLLRALERHAEKTASKAGADLRAFGTTKQRRAYDNFHNRLRAERDAGFPQETT